MKGQSDLGTVLRIERSSIHDGNGFRTVVFLKGCPLRCHWCSTPESHSFQIEQTENNTYGKVMTVEEVMSEVRKDSLFYFHSGGGMTLSGGEPLAQPNFALAILKQCKDELINTAVETTLFAKWEVVSSILPYVDTLFVDVKFIDKELHQKYCGVDNQLILENLLKTNEIDLPFKLIVRILIVHVNDDLEREVERTAEFAAGLKHLDHVQLLSYHRLGTDTYRKLGLDYQLPDLLPPSEELMERCRKLVKRHVKTVK